MIPKANTTNSRATDKHIRLHNERLPSSKPAHLKPVLHLQENTPKVSTAVSPRSKDWLNTANPCEMQL